MGLVLAGCQILIVNLSVSYSDFGGVSVGLEPLVVSLYLKKVYFTDCFSFLFWEQGVV
jgi:hypothetical protein